MAGKKEKKANGGLTPPVEKPARPATGRLEMRLEVDLIERLKARAVAEHRSLTGLVRHFCEVMLARPASGPPTS